MTLFGKVSHEAKYPHYLSDAYDYKHMLMNADHTENSTGGWNTEEKLEK